MIIHEQTLLSEDLFEKQFICDLQRCKGACCVEGDFGAPLNEDEIALLEQELTALQPFLTDEGLEVIAEKGVWERDKDGDLVTTCLPTGECVFAINEQGILGCGIEKAWRNKATNFQKPISCHLYPIRINNVGEYDALNYHKWGVCKPACELGEAHQMPVYKFLRGPLIRKYGEEWFNELEEIAEAYKQNL